MVEGRKKEKVRVRRSCVDVIVASWASGCVGCSLVRAFKWCEVLWAIIDLQMTPEGQRRQRRPPFCRLGEFPFTGGIHALQSLNHDARLFHTQAPSSSHTITLTTAFAFHSPKTFSHERPPFSPPSQAQYQFTQPGRTPCLRLSPASMARRARNDENGRVHLPPPPSFLSLPDIAHASISSFLHYGNDSRLRVSRGLPGPARRLWRESEPDDALLCRGQ